MSYSKKVKKEILEKGLEIYKEDPAKLNPHFVAKALNISNAKIHYHFGQDLRDAVLKYGVEKGDSHLIVQLYARGSDLVKDIDEDEMQAHNDAVFKST